MKQAAVVLFKFALLAPSALIAQDSLEGKYSGSFAQPSYSHIGTGMGITVTILSVQDGAIKATGAIHRGPCKGDYELIGMVNDNRVRLHSTARSGTTKECPFVFRGVVENGELVGKFNRGNSQRFPDEDIHLRK